MLKNFFPRRKPRFPFLLLAFLSLFLLGEVSRQTAPILTRQTYTQSRVREDSDNLDQTQKTRSAATAALMNLPLSFEPAGGTHQFLVRGAGYDLLLTPSQATIASNDGTGAKFLRLKLAGANIRAPAVALDPLPGRRNYLLGNDPAKWRTDVPTYARVRYDKVYPGISLAYYGRQSQLEYHFEIAPGADPHAIRLALSRDLRPHIAANGDLILSFAGGEVREAAPIIYQEIAGSRQSV